MVEDGRAAVCEKFRKLFLPESSPKGKESAGGFALDEPSADVVIGAGKNGVTGRRHGSGRVIHSAADQVGAAPLEEKA